MDRETLAVPLSLGGVAAQLGPSPDCGPPIKGRCVIETVEANITSNCPTRKTHHLVVFLHGYGGSGCRNHETTGAMVEPLLERGYAVMAPEGLETTGPGRHQKLELLSGLWGTR